MLPLAQTPSPPAPLGDVFTVRSSRRVHLGPVRVKIRSNEPDFKGFRFFSTVAARPCPDTDDESAAPDFTLSLCNLRIDGPWPLPTLREMQDKSYRAKRMSAGYYLTDHFGTPAYLMTRGTHYWIFAEDFESILWPYAIKSLLTLYCTQHDLLHLKAAAVAVDGQGVLLVGRGGSGKTVLLSQLCGAGAQFLSNTHTLVDRQNLVGIRTAMRVRPDKFFGPVIATRHLAPSVKPGEYCIDPIADLGWQSASRAPVGSICLVDYRGYNTGAMKKLDPGTMLDYMEQFSLALSVYGLKEDVLDELGADVARFSLEMSKTRDRLNALVRHSHCYYVSCDASDPESLRSILDILKTPNRHGIPDQAT